MMGSGPKGNQPRLGDKLNAKLEKINIIRQFSRIIIINIR
jgi:hypothetical protein